MSSIFRAGSPVVVAVSITLALGGCKSEEEKRTEALREQIKLAEAEAKKAEVDLAVAQKKLAESAEKLGEQGAALGAQGAAVGMQAAAAGLAAAGAAMNNLAGSAAGAATGPLVDFRALKALLPESVGSLKRVGAEGEKSVALGFGVSKAKAKYEDGPARLEIELLDVASVGGAAMMAFGIGMVEIDKETEDGYEKTSTEGGRKRIEKYDGKRKKGEIKLVVGNRFLVDIEGRGVEMKDVKGALEKIDLGKLEGLASAATAAK